MTRDGLESDMTEFEAGLFVLQEGWALEMRMTC